MGKYRTRELTQRVRYALLAGVAGAFLIPQVAAAAPTGHHGETTGVHVAGEGTATTTITATAANNVIKWADYSVKQGETVNYDGKNYLNIVTGGNTSAINGTINNTGGDIYLVNPNGVIFGKTASVNVGNLYVSTQEESTLNTTAFEGSGTGSGNSPLSTSAGDVGKADVVNMGSITANKVEVYGRSIRILDAANVHVTTSPVILHTDTVNDGYAHIGYQSGAEPAATAYKVNGANAVAADNYYQLVSTPTEFQSINSGLTKNYMLANDIDFTDSATNAAGEITPIGGNTIGATTYDAYSGKFDGNFFRVQNFKVTDANLQRSGLFGALDHAEIYNLGVTGATVQGSVTNGAEYAGGLAAVANNGTKLTNVYVRDTTVSGNDDRHGGLVGYTADTTIDSAYTKVAVATGGGFVGETAGGTVITNTYSEFTNSPGTSGALFINRIMPASGTTVKNSYTKGDFSNYSSIPNVTGTYIIDDATKTARLRESAPGTGDPAYITATYAGWSINNTGAPGAKWRIYEGRTLPLLTAFMDGTATATYDIRYFNANRTLNTESATTAKSNNGADITTGLTYNSQYIKIVGKDGSGADVVGGKSNVVTYAGAMQYNADGTPNLDHIYDYVSAGTNDFDKTNGIRNAGTKAILWSDQDGPNLRGVNVTIDKRKVDMTVAGDFTAERQYNGKLDVKDAFIEKVLGGISTKGFTREDSDPNHPTVSLNTTGFTATMVDKHVGTGKVANFGGSIGLSGEDKDNYDFDGNLAGKTGKVNITKAPLLLSFRKKKADERVYDGTSVVRDDEMKQSVSPGNISINKTIAAGSRGEVMTDETGTADVLALADITDPKYTDTAGNEQIHQGAHKLQYTNVKLRTDGIYSSGQDYELYYTPEDNHEVPVTNDTVYLDGRITRRQIKTGDFKVYHKTDNSAADATKVYDGTAAYDLNDPRYSDIYLSSNVGATDDNTGVVARDQGHITFLLQNGTTATFMTDELTPSETKNVKTAKKIAYKVHADADTHTDVYGGHLLDDYWVVNDKDTALTESTNFNATGKGTITPKALTATVVNNHITKVYDGWTKQTDGNRTLTPGKDLVTISGYVAGDSPRTNTSTADYASPNVVWDATNQTEKAQNVTYHVSFERGTGDESENYILDANATGDARYGIELTQDSAGKNYTGTITPRPITITMGTVDKIYDGTAVNTKSNITGLAGTTTGDTIAATILADDGITAATLKAQHAAMLTAGTAHSSFGRGTGSSFDEDVNASNGTEHDVRYQNVGNVLQEALAAAKKHNYTIDDTIYGKGTINRRLIEKSGFQVRDKDGGIANATKVYDGTSTFQLKNGETLVAKTAATGSDTGVVAKDKDNIFFTMTGDNGHFTSDAAGANHTSHKSEAKHVAYDVIADSHDKSVSPLTNYYFGTSGTDKRDLETVNADTPDAVVAEGRITSAKIQAQTKKLKEKVYDGMAEHTDGNRNILTGSEIVALPLITDATGQPTNTSSAAYINKNVERDSDGVIIEKAVNYTAQLKGKYADDYEIVDADNNVISSVNGTGDSKTVTATRNNVANMGKITPRKLNITMASVSKVYDTNAENTATNNTAAAPSGTVDTITDDPKSSVIGTILSGESTPITEAALGAAWRTLRDHSGATSTYGHKDSTSFSDDANASAVANGHDVVYHHMDTAFKDAFGTVGAGNYTVDEDVYGKGTITPKSVDPNQFDVVDANGHTVSNAKTYDGTSDRPIENGWKIQSGATTGLYAQDASHISFALSSKGAYYIDKNGNKTAQTTNTGTTAETDIDAVKAAYHVTAHADAGYEKLLKNYTLNGETLDSGEAKVYGSGKITRRTINIALAEKENIDKVYDGTRNLVDGTVNGKELHHSAFVDADAKANVVYATGTANDNKLVRTKNGAKVDDNAVVTVAGSYADKSVARNPAREIIDKVITYNVSIGDNVGKNYTLSYNDGATTRTKNAEEGLDLSAKGTITPKDLSGAFAKITKVYDGTTAVDHAANPTVTPAQVGFTAGAVIAGDDVTLATHNEVFQSANVRGDGTTKTIDGTEQKNWINYTNVTLAGADEGNYELKPDKDRKLYGLGEIKPFEIDDNTHIVYGTITPATKTYDGTRAVKKLVDGVESAKNEDVKGYIQHAYITLGTWTKDLIGRMKVDSATYDTKDAASTPKDVTYNLKYTPEADGNIIMKPGTQVVKAFGKGTILKRDVTVTVNPLTKEYDAGPAVKDASGNIITGAALNDLVTLDGLTKDDAVAVTKNDNTTYTTKAVYVDTDAGTGDRHVKYTITLNSNAGNYNLKYKSGNGNEFLTGDNTITKRRVDVKFKDPTSSQPFTRTYNGSARNTFIHPYVDADDAAVLKTDANTLVNGTDLVGLTGISSTYVKDDKMTPDPNVGKNKYIRFDGVDTALGTALAGKVANYTFTIGSATGEITKRTITVDDLKKGISFTRAEKEYDATKDIVNAKGNLEHAYILDASDNPLVDDTGAKIDLKDFFDIDNARTHYNVTENADTNPQSVTYGLVYRGGANPNLTLGEATFDMWGTGYGGSTIDGIIKRRVLNLNLVKDHDIDKPYDGTAALTGPGKHWNALKETDADGNVQYAAGSTDKNKLVKTDGTSFKIESNYRNDGDTANDKNVKYNGSAVDEKKIRYDITITGGDARNYSFEQNGVETDAENGLKLSATGKITPKDLSGAFAKITKVYDGTPDVDHTANPTVTPAQVGFTPGAIISGDTVNLATHNEAFQSKNVNGDGVNTWTPTEGTEKDKVQKNWINYSGLTLGGADAGNYRIDSTAKGLGEITPLNINGNVTFTMETNPAEKFYDGTRALDPQDAKHFIRSAIVNGTTLDILGDLDVDTATYQSTANATNGGPAQKVVYKMKTNDTLGNINITGDLTAEGDGIIKRRVLNLNLVKDHDIDKPYDGTAALTGPGKHWNALKETDADGNVQYAVGSTDKNKLVTTDGTSFDIQSSYRDSSGNRTKDKDVAYDTVTPGKVIEKAIEYTISITGGDAHNYAFANGTSNPTNAENSLTLLAKGTINRKDLSGAFAKITKVYDGTPDVDHAANPTVTPAQVGFTPGAIISGDTVSLATHAEAFQSANVNGDGVHTWTPIEGPEKDKAQKNWINYSNLSLGGADAGNYRIDSTAKGLGEITPFVIDANTHIDYGNIKRATKTYDGTMKVKKLVGGVESADKGAVKGYIPQFKWNGYDISDSVEVDTAEYDSKDVKGEAEQNVTYKFKLSGNNQNFQLGAGAEAALQARGKGIITKRDVNVTVKNPLTKEYDADTVVRESGRVITGAALNDLVTLDGLTKDDAVAVTKNDNATYTTNAEYDNTNLNAGTNKKVNYTVNLDAASAGNYNLIYDGGSGNSFSTRDNTITPRRIYADVQDFHPIKVYDKNDAIVGSVKDDAGRPLTEEDLQKYAVYRHYVDPTTGDPQDTKAFVDVDATPHMTAKFSDEKVAWKDGSWRNTPQGDAKDVVYAFSLAGASAAENYEFVDQDGKTIMQSVTGTTRSTGTTRADGRIDPYRIELRGRSEPYEIRVNEAVPSTFDGSPIGRNYRTPLGESLDGEISYRADVPVQGPRWGIDYPIYGHYQPGSSDLYQNYYFDSVPGTLRVNTYVPDYEYDKAMTQVSKMTPDEYAYENASLDRTNQYSRKPTAQVDPVPPAINVVKDGVDIRQNDINVLDDTVYTIVDEVFG